MSNLRLLAGALAALSLPAAVLVAGAPAAQAATTLRAAVTVDITGFNRMLREEETAWCGDSEYLVHTDIGMFELPRVAARSHLYEHIVQPYYGWQAGTALDLSGTVTTFTDPDYPAQEWISGQVNVVEDDTALCGGGDDPLDMNPQPGSSPTSLTFIIEPSSGRVFAYNYLDPLWIVGWLYEPTGAVCRFAAGRTCSGSMTVRAPGGWTSMAITIRAL